MTGKAKASPLCLTIFLFAMIVSLSGCAHTGQSVVARQRAKTAEIPSGWRSPVILLENRTDLTFEVHRAGNRVIETNDIWAYVKKRNPNDWERIAIFDVEAYEKPVKIKADAYYPDGSHWKLDSRTVERNKIPQSSHFINQFNIPRYDAGVFIHLETKRDYFH